MTLSDKIGEANRAAFSKIDAAKPLLAGIKTAGSVIPGMEKNVVLYAGPPAESAASLPRPTLLAAQTALVYEGLAANEAAALELIERGDVWLDSALNHAAVVPHAGVLSYSMPVWVVLNDKFGNFCYAAVAAGFKNSIAFGGAGERVGEQLDFIEKTVFPVLSESVGDPVDLRSLLAESIQMGDDGHLQTRAGSALLANALAPRIWKSRFSSAETQAALEFLCSAPRSFLGLSTAIAKSSLDPIQSTEHSTLVAAMARGNGQFGLCVAGLGRRWFTAPVEQPTGVFEPGYSQADAGPDCGDGSFLEALGLGRACFGGSLRSAGEIGEMSKDAYNYTLHMYEICEGESSYYKLPSLSNRGAAMGIDIRKVVKTAIYPSVYSAFCAADGRGLIGNGLVSAADSCFNNAIRECYSNWQ